MFVPPRDFINVYSPVNIRQKRRDLEQIEQKVSWAHLEAGSVLINILKVAENPKLPSCNFWGKNKGF